MLLRTGTRREIELQGFTLIELLIVIAIILILIAIALPNFLEAQIRAKVTRAHGELRSIKTAIETYNLDWNRYPPTQYFEATQFSPPTDINRYSIMQLTTPGEYIPFLLDPFQPPIGEPLLACSAKIYCDCDYPSAMNGLFNKFTDLLYGRSYLYATQYSVRQYKEWTLCADFMKTQGVEYVILSVGPDGIWSQNTETGGQPKKCQGWGYRSDCCGECMYYSPTNGTKSIGDIVVQNNNLN